MNQPAKPFPLFIISLSLFGFHQVFNGQPCPAADWGYDEPQKAEPARKDSLSGPSRTPTSTTPGIGAKNPPRVPGKAAQTQTQIQTQTLTKPSQAVPPQVKPRLEKLTDERAWLEIFALMASTLGEDDRKAIATLSTLSAEQKERLEKLLKTKLSESSKAYAGIAPIWAPLRAKVFDDIDYKESYRLLFRSLTRHWLLKSDKASEFDGKKAEALTLSQAGKEQPAEKPSQHSTEELFAEILGPSMVAETGPPPLTADAINAYADMTCFLYQKKHPDKSIDQDDNRQIFANVIREKFQTAPDKQARLAMSNFDLTWACFRCRYLDSSVQEREKLSITAGAPISGQGKADLTTSTIHTLFKLGPWGDFNVSAKNPSP